MRTYVDKEFPFGKHQGELISDVESSYLRWLMEQDWFAEGTKFSDLAGLVEMDLEYRDNFDLHF